MDRKRLIQFFCCAWAGLALCGFSENYQRGVSGEWSESGSWKVQNSAVEDIPSENDKAVLLSAVNGTVSLSSSDAEIEELVVGIWNGALNKLVTFNVRKNLIVDRAVNIGASELRPGNGAMTVEGAEVTTGFAQLGTSNNGTGTLTVNAGGHFECTSGRLQMAAKSEATVNAGGIISMEKLLTMEEGAKLYLNGTGEVWVMGRNVAKNSSDLTDFIADGWIYGDGIAGKVKAVYDGDKTVISVSAEAPAVSKAEVPKEAEFDAGQGFAKKDGGNWTILSAWKEGGRHAAELPGENSDAALLSPVEGHAVTQSDAPIVLRSLVVGAGEEQDLGFARLKAKGDVALSKKFDVGVYGHGWVDVLGGKLSAPSFEIGSSDESLGRLMIDGGATMECSGSFVMNSRSMVTVDDGILSIAGDFEMAPDATLDINRDSQVWIYGRDQSRPGSALVQYIKSKQISGDDTDSNVQVTYDGEKNILTTEFKVLRYRNPNAVVNLEVGTRAYPLPMDFDLDGDIDLLAVSSSAGFSGLYYFENTSGNGTLVLEPGGRLLRKIKSAQASLVDGEPRVVVQGAELTDFRTFLDREAEDFSIGRDAMRGISQAGFTPPQWEQIDYDGDGDLDIIVGSFDWRDYGNRFKNSYYTEEGVWDRGPLHGHVHVVENTGDGYEYGGMISGGGKLVDVYGMPGPSFADYDHDGDLDLICGETVNRLHWVENIGTREKPEFAEQRCLENADGLIVGQNQIIIPTAVDWDQDGFVDVVIGDSDGQIGLVRNTGRVEDHMPVFESVVYFQQKADAVTIGSLATPFSTDWDDDGDEDLICGVASGFIYFIENLGGDLPSWAAPQRLQADGKDLRILAGSNGSIQGPVEAQWGYTTQSVADWDGDGLKDLVVNSVWGKVVWYKNIGTKGSPKLAAQQPVKVDWGGKPAPKPYWVWWTPGETELAPPWRTTPYAIDWNKDGLTDLISLDHEGYLAYFERFEKDGELFLKPGERIFYHTQRSKYNSGNGSRINGEFVKPSPGLMQFGASEYGDSGRRKFTFVDWDGDGDLDMAANSMNVVWFRNIGTKNGRVLFENGDNLSDVRITKHTSSPTTVDWDGDGIRDLLVGAEGGRLYLLKNKRGE